MCWGFSNTALWRVSERRSSTEFPLEPMLVPRAGRGNSHFLANGHFPLMGVDRAIARPPPRLRSALVC